MKICSVCNKQMDFCCFHKWKYGKDGYRNQCKSCRKATAAQYYLNNKDMIDARNREYNEKNFERESKRKKEYASRNKEANAARHREWYKNNREYKLEKNREWYNKNEEKRKYLQRAKARRRRAMLASVNEDFREESTVYKVFNNECFFVQNKR